MRLFLLITIIATTNLFAATITVVNTNDAGAGSLRQAIIDANNGDTVNFDLMLLSTGSDTIKLNSEIAFSKTIVIDGYYTSYDTLFISGENSNRIFNITNSSGTVVLNGLTLVNGNELDGGAIYKNSGGTLIIEDCNLMNNNATDQGGAIHKNNGYMLVSGCQIFNNSAVTQGGGVYLSPSGTNTFEYTTFYNNSSQGDGGGMYGFVADADFTHCTFTENNATGVGGAIYDWGSSVIMNITNCTFLGNVASASGAIEFWGSGVVFTIGSSIIAGNPASENLDVWGAGAILNSNGYNIFGDATYGGSVASDQLGASTGTVTLGTLQDNGSTTYTMMPIVGSIAIDLGDPADMSDAQNGIITDGTRDAGSAENYSCPDMYASFYVFDCASYTVPSGDETYSLTGTTVVYDTIPTVCGSDSLLTIIVVIDDITAPIPDIGSLPDLIEQCEATPGVPTATDACAGSITGTTTTFFPITTTGTTVVTWTFDDGAGNISTQDQNIIITGLDLTVAQTGFTLTANSAGSTFQWLDCDNGFSQLPGETNADFTATNNGSYAVEITNGSCTDTSACYIISGIGFEEHDILEFNVFPNPTNGTFTVITSSLNSYLSLYSMDGKVIINQFKLTDTEHVFNLNGIERGVYLVELTTYAERKTIRLIVE